MGVEYRIIAKKVVKSKDDAEKISDVLSKEGFVVEVNRVETY